MKVLIASLFRVFFCVIGGYFIGCALDRFEKKHWFMVGLDIMLAAWMTGELFTTLV